MIEVDDATGLHELRFDGRTLCFDATIFLQPTRSVPDIGTALMIAGGTADTGPYLVTGISRPATDEEVERFMMAMHALDRELPAGDGSLVTFRVVVNTDEDIAAPTLRVAKAIKQRGLDGVVAAGIVPEATAADVWVKAKQSAARRRVEQQS